MDSKSESTPGDSAHIQSIQEKEAAVRRALNSVLIEIDSKDTYTPQEATELAVRFATYFQEANLYAEDDVEARNQSRPADEQSWHNPVARGIAEEALDKAFRDGDYHGLKELMESQWTRGFTIRRGIPLDPKLNMISQVIPERGDPIKMIQPAWMDERFTLRVQQQGGSM